MKIYQGLLLVAAGCISFSSVAQASTVISSGPTTGAISPFGLPQSETYGQVFTAPITGTLTSFSLSLDGGVGALIGGVGTWNGPSTFGFGYGSPVTLYTSAETSSVGAGTFTFSPNIAVIAGEHYVAYLSVFGVAGASGQANMPISSVDVPGLDYFVWNNGSSPAGNSSWNYFFDAGNAEFSATFEQVSAAPEPATWIMMIVGFGAVGVSLRRRRGKVLGKTSFA